MSQSVNEIGDLRKTASKLRKNSSFEEAIKLYQKLYEEHKEKCDKWDIWGYAFCLRKTGATEKALDLCREIYKLDSKFEMGNSLYAWCIYDLEIKNGPKESKDRFFKAAKAICKLTPDQGKTNPFVRTVFKVLDVLKEPYKASEIFEWTEKLDPIKLSEECFQFKDKAGETRELPSEKENYYAVRTKALEKLELHKDCIALCREGLSAISKFHFNNDVWMKRRIALSETAMGAHDVAIKELMDILTFRSEWFIQMDIANLYFKKNLFNEAHQYAVDACLNFGDLEFKWELFFLLGEILIKKGDIEYGKKHFLLSAKVREGKEWKLPENLKQKLSEYNIVTDNSVKLNELHEELKKYWEAFKFNNLPQLSGTVKTLLTGGKAGFIKADNGKEYYFRVSSFRGNKSRLNNGLKVNFYVDKGFDKIKNRESEQAIQIFEK